MTALSIFGLYLFVSIGLCVYQAGNQFRSVGCSFVHVTRRFRDNQNRPYAVPEVTTISLELSCFSLSLSSQAALIPSSATAIAVAYDEAARSPLRLKPKASRVELVLPDMDMSLFCSIHWCRGARPGTHL